jgi:RNA polymerase sigma-70 factor (ECF subfamily)
MRRSEPSFQGSGRFATTHWSLIASAKTKDSPEAREALSGLCQSYWYPIYAFIRRQGHASDQTEDLTQEFFTRLLEKDALAGVDREKGRFRSFLLACVKHFLANERDRNKAQKRGGGKAVISLHVKFAEERYQIEPSHNLTAEKLFDRGWAMAVLDQALLRLREETAGPKNDGRFDILKQFLLGTAGQTYAEAAKDLGLSEGAVKVAVHRLRRRYRDLLHKEIGKTVKDPAEIESELDDLFRALAP